MRKVCVSFLCVAIFSFAACAAPTLRARTPVLIPDVPGYITIKGDFHMHTVFSDGYVWPTIRVEEAWRDGLDAIAISDHLEYLPFKSDVSPNRDRSYEIARRAGDPLDILVVKGAEITRDMPPGHLNALFITNAEALAVPRWEDAVEEARKQGAYIFYNHPGWAAQAAGGVGTLYAEHKKLIAQGTLRGIEIVNGPEYYPEAFSWANEHNLTMFGNSDVHEPIGLSYPAGSDRRPITLVYVKERSIKGIREAFDQGRTVVFSQNRLVGKEDFLRPIFEQSVKVLNPKFPLRGTERKLVQIHNISDVNYELELAEDHKQINALKGITLNARQTVLLQVSGRSKEQSGGGKVALRYRVKNLLYGPREPLVVSINIELL